MSNMLPFGPTKEPVLEERDQRDSKSKESEEVNDSQKVEKQEAEMFSSVSNPMPKIGGISVQTSSNDTSADRIIGGLNHKTTNSGDRRAAITFTESLRANARLVQDRILSFACYVCTRYDGTEWILGAIFYYKPEPFWRLLLMSRRRWLNGTFASFLFFFKPMRAKTRIRSGMYDSHKANKNILLVNALWSMQLFQLLLVLITPAIFGSATFIGIRDCAALYPPMFGWAAMNVFGSITFVDIWMVFYTMLYSTWTIHSLSLIAFNIVLSWVLINVLKMGYSFIIAFMILMIVWADL